MLNHSRISRLGGLVLVLVGVLAFWSGHVAAGAEPTLAQDNSLSTKEYLDAGVPAIDKPWKTADYEKASAALKEITKNDITKLPRFQGKNSGEVFAHLIAQQNLDALSDKAVPIDTRIQLAAAIVAYAGVFSLYTDATKPDHSFDSEMLELGGFLLRAELAASLALTEFKAAHGMKEDNDGFKQARAGFAQTVRGMVQVMSDRTNVRTSETVRFAGELKVYLPKLSEQLLPEAQAELKKQLTDAAVASDDAGVKAAFAGLADVLK